MNTCFLTKSTRSNDLLGNLLRNKTKYGNLETHDLGTEIPDNSSDPDQLNPTSLYAVGYEECK